MSGPGQPDRNDAVRGGVGEVCVLGVRDLYPVGAAWPHCYVIAQEGTDDEFVHLALLRAIGCRVPVCLGGQV
jgi:hypothetical protein